MAKKSTGVAAAAPTTMQYVGPDYNLGIGINTGDSHHIEVRPRDFDEPTRLAFIAAYPELAIWWTKPAPEQEQATEPEA